MSAVASAAATADDEFCEAEDWSDQDAGLRSASTRSVDASDGEEAAFYDADRQLDGDMTTQYPAHAAAFYGDIERLLQLLGDMTEEQQGAQDPQGNTVLHIAALRENLDLARALTKASFPVMKQNSRGWLALDEAVSLKNREMAELLYFAMVDQMKATMKAKRKGLLESMADMPDHNLSLQWELGSPVFGFLLRKYAPHDTYQVWKRGQRVRVDGTLMGVDKKSTGMLPAWKRGAFSLLFDGSVQPARVVLLDRDKRTYIDVQKEKKAAKHDRESEVQGLMGEGPGKTKMKMSDFHFKPVKTLFGNPSTEKIAGWRTKVYEATGKLVAVTTAKTTVVIPPDATFEDYLELSVAEDRSIEIPIDPLSTKGMNGGKEALAALDSEATPEELEEAAAAEAAARKKGGRKITARCWMAEEFPLSLKQLLPVMDVVGYANKYLKKVGKFMQKYGQMNLFPVKLQVPIILTVYLVLVNKSFRLLDSADEAWQDAFYEIPADFELKEMKKDRMMSFDDDDPFTF